jgi:hypothetical protein
VKRTAPADSLATTVDAPPAAPPARSLATARTRRDLRAALLLGLVCLLVYNANLRWVGAVDTYPARYLPFGILRYGSLLFDPILDFARDGSLHPRWMVTTGEGHVVSMYPVVLPVLATPLYIPAFLYLQARGWDTPRVQLAARIMEKVTASLLAAATVALMYLLLRRRADRGAALLLTLAFAFGTTTWAVSSQAMWQHGLGELLMVGALLLLTGPCTARRALAAGALCVLIAGNRPPDVILGAALGLYALRWAGRGRALLVAAGAAVPLALLLTYNLAVVGNLGGGYLAAAYPSHPGSPGVDVAARNHALFGHGMASGIAGMLFSPARGLFVFSPFLLFLPFGFRRALGPDRRDRELTLYLAAAMAVQVALYAKGDWRAGASWGPRWLTDMVPLLVWMLGPVVATLRGAGRTAFAALAALSIAIEAVGAFWYTGTSEAAIFAVRPGAAEMSGVWPPANAPFIAELRHARPAADLTLTVRGFIDRVGSNRAGAAPVPPDEPLRVVGWALAGGATPFEVVVGVDDLPLAATVSFADRPDIRTDFQVTGPSQWDVTLPIKALARGPHLLQAWARSGRGGLLLPVAQTHFLIAPRTPRRPGASNLQAAARTAAAALREHQQPGGYWLTSYTSQPRFADPRREMNTFVTSMILDVLAPVAEPAGLGETLRRARRHLTAQIEASGLVRYHGRPDAPEIRTLGCPITPDADDTALAWRLAPSGDPVLLARALAVLRRYRTAEGLYRTWLAPRDQYQCIDPGRDPNPADVGIQMHLFLFFARADPPAARALCAALGRAIADERIWVYYKVAPLVPVLRQADLLQAGCPLRIPPARLAAAAPGDPGSRGVPGQEAWTAAARLLVRQEGADGPRPGAAETHALLASLAQDGFAALRRTPPLLYHNDFTGSTPRFYWSEDFGYALWLRLYLATATP